MMKTWYNIPVNNMKKYIVIYIDQEKGGASLPFAFHEAYNTKEEARQAIIDDLEGVIDDDYELDDDGHGVLKANIKDNDSLETIVYHIQPIEF